MNTPLSRFLTFGLASFALAAFALTGCGIGTLSTTSGPIEGNFQIQGKVHGGEQPVVNSNIQVFATGATGYGTGAASIMTATVKTDSNGFFLLTGNYSCPSSTSLVYITATGGDPGGGSSNSALKLATAIGTCATLQSASYVWINEVTTAAMAYSLGQYFTTTLGSTSTDGFGAPNTTQGLTGITNAFATFNNLVSATTGVAVNSSTVTGAGSTLTIVPETAKLYTVANIIASCVNTTGASSTACSTFFSDVTPSAGTPPTDTLQAAVELNLQPATAAANVTALYGLQTATSPYPGLATQPTDWTLGIQYQDNAGTFFIKPQNIAVDSLGDVWVLSNSTGLGGLVEVSPTGTPLSNISTLAEQGPFTSSTTTPNPPVLSSPKTTTTTLLTQNATFTTSFGSATNNPAINPRNLAIDPNNNVWFTQSSGVSSTTGFFAGATATIPASGNIFEVATTTGLPNGSTFGFATGKSAYGLAIDNTGNVFAGDQSSSSYFGVYEFPYNSTAGSSILTPAAYPPDSSSAVPEYMAIDKTGNQWFTSGAATTSAYKLSGASASGCALTASTLCQPTGSSYTSITLTGAGTPYGVAEGTTGMWFANSTGTPGLLLVPFANTASTTSNLSANYFTAPHYPAVDGLGNVWVGNAVGPGTAATTGGSASAISAAGAYLSPSNGGSTTIAPGFTHLGLTYPFGTAIDPSGNVWFANNQIFSSACTAPLTINTTTGASTNTCSSIFELVGAAAPVVTPIAAFSTTGPARP